jgi:hypothetical protein
MIKVGQVKSIIVEYKDGTVETLDPVRVTKMEVVHSGANKGEDYTINTFTVKFVDLDDYNKFMTQRLEEYVRIRDLGK